MTKQEEIREWSVRRLPPSPATDMNKTNRVILTLEDAGVSADTLEEILWALIPIINMAATGEFSNTKITIKIDEERRGWQVNK